MINVIKHGIVLEKDGVEFENAGILNPAVIYEDGQIHVFYRAVREDNYSSIGYCKMISPLISGERNKTPVIHPEFGYESHGVEDPRIVKIDDTYYLTYTAYDGVNALGALALSKDLLHFDKMGIIVPMITYHDFGLLAESKGEINEKYLRYNKQGGNTTRKGKDLFVWDKNLIFFPRRINGKLHFLHRIKPDIQIVAVNNLEELTPAFWTNYYFHLARQILMTPKYDHEISYIGGGCPPIETNHGWLLIYHSVHDTIGGYVYSACAALLDLQDPQKEIARLPYPLFLPDQKWELKGAVNNVCFPTGTVLQDDTLYIYYGAADEHVACASLSMSVLIGELLSFSVNTN